MRKTLVVVWGRMNDEVRLTTFRRPSRRPREPNVNGQATYQKWRLEDSNRKENDEKNK